MLNEIIVECPREDFDDLVGIGYEELPTKHMHGAIEVVEIAVKLTAASVPLIAAFLAKKSKAPVVKRRVILDGQRKVFENVPTEEITQILNAQREEPR